MANTLHTLMDTARAMGAPADVQLIVVDVVGQRLHLLDGNAIAVSYPVSTSQYGLGNRVGSFCTPPGWHCVVERFGDQTPAGTVFRERKATGELLATEHWGGDAKRSDLIVSRILRLAGMEPGLNQGEDIDSYARYIYLHGTNHEERIGSPASQGCIRLRNTDIIQLFERTRDREVWCWIGPLDQQPPLPSRRAPQTSERAPHRRD